MASADVPAHPGEPQVPDRAQRQDRVRAGVPAMVGTSLVGALVGGRW